MVQLRVDVEASNARREFESAARGVESLRDEMQRAERESQQLSRAYQEASTEASRLGRRVGEARDNLDRLTRAAAAADREVDRLQGELRRLGSAAPAQLHTDLANAQREAARLSGEVRQANRHLTQTARDATRANEALRRAAGAAHDAGDESRRLAHELHLAQLRADLLRYSLQRADRQANQLGNRLRRGLLGFREQADRLLSGNGGFRNMIGDAWRSLPTEMKALGVAVGAAFAFAFVAAAGAIVQAALLTVVGGAVLGLGTLLAAKTSGVVRDAFKGVFTPILDDLKSFSLQFEGPLVDSARIFGDTWRTVGDDVRDVFAQLGTTIKPLATGLSGMVENAMPGFKKAVAAAVPVLEELARLMPELGDAMSDFFESISKGDGLVKGMRLTVYLLAAALVFFGNTIEFLSNRFDQLTTFIGDVLNAAAKAPFLFGVAGVAVEKAAAAFNNLNQAGGSGIITLDQATTAAGGTSLALGRQADASRRAADEMRKLSEKMAEYIGIALGADQAAIAWEAAIDDVTKAITRQNNSIDIGTEKGRANVGVILNAVDAAERKRQADIALAGGENASAEAIGNANAAFRRQLDQLAGVLRAAGLTEAQIRSLLGKYYELAASPNINKTITVSTRYIESGRRPGVGTGLTFNRYGGVYGPAMADKGLINLSGRAGIFSAGARPLYGFAEAGTRGEAFIARNAPRARSLAIARTAAGWHGATVVPNEMIGRGGGGGNAYSITVNVAPGGNLAEAGRQTVEAIRSYERTSGTGWRR